MVLVVGFVSARSERNRSRVEVLPKAGESNVGSSGKLTMLDSELLWFSQKLLRAVRSPATIELDRLVVSFRRYSMKSFVLPLLSTHALWNTVRKDYISAEL